MKALVASVSLESWLETRKEFEEEGGVPGGVLEVDGQASGDNLLLFTSSVTFEFIVEAVSTFVLLDSFLCIN